MEQQDQIYYPAQNKTKQKQKQKNTKQKMRQNMWNNVF